VQRLPIPVKLSQMVSGKALHVAFEVQLGKQTFWLLAFSTQWFCRPLVATPHEASVLHEAEHHAPRHVPEEHCALLVQGSPIRAPGGGCEL
jgi:hypothetical protein